MLHVHTAYFDCWTQENRKRCFVCSVGQQSKRSYPEHVQEREGEAPITAAAPKLVKAYVYIDTQAFKELSLEL